MIRIPEPILRTIEAAAEAAYPDECCGFLVGRFEDFGNVVVTIARRSPNVFDGDKTRNFLTHPKIHFNLMHKYRDGPECIVGHYHSHTNGVAKLSKKDRQSAYYPEHVWIVIGVDRGRVTETNAFRKNARTKRFRKIPIVAISGHKRIRKKRIRK